MHELPHPIAQLERYALPEGGAPKGAYDGAFWGRGAGPPVEEGHGFAVGDDVGGGGGGGGFECEEALSGVSEDGEGFGGGGVRGAGAARSGGREIEI
ncbi:hypothetical protein V492_01526 [Pseudogymnoascus sp. VKM F-4246]|nr:hypothetical protein V492_01526 [Pseudogymnoascus sp. VKM F-4246]